MKRETPTDPNADAIRRLRSMFVGPDGRAIPPELTQNANARKRYCEAYLDDDDLALVYVEESLDDGRVRCYFRRPLARDGGLPCFLA